MMDMYGGMMGMGSLGGGAMLLAWLTWVLVVVLIVAAIRWLWKEGSQ